MPKSKFTETQRLAILAKQDKGQKVEAIWRKHQISPAKCKFFAEEVAALVADSASFMAK